MILLLRLGLIGAGRWGRNYIKTIAALDGVRLVRLASRNPESVKLVESDCIISADWREMIAGGDLDGVIIATPPALHAEMARAAVAAGLPVLVEKPLTLSLTEAQELRDFVVARGGFVMIGHTHLFHPAFRALKRIAPQYGPVRAIHAEAGNHGPFRPDVPVLWDWGAHDIAMCLDLLGAMPAYSSARRVERRELDEGLGEIVDVRLEFPGGIPAEIRVGNILPRRRRFMVRFDAASLLYDDLADNKLEVHSPGALAEVLGPATRVLPISPELPLTCLVREFTQAIRAGSRDYASMELGVAVITVLTSSDATLLSRP